MGHHNIPLGHKGRVFFLSGKYSFTVYLVTACVLHILKGKYKTFTLKTWKSMWKRKNDVYWYSLVGCKGFKLCIPLKSDKYYSYIKTS